jgi:WD40 repeat protein
VPSGQQVASFEHPEATGTLALSPDGGLLAVSLMHHISHGPPFEIHVWSLERRDRIARLPGHDHFVYEIVFGPGNRWLASVGHDRRVRIWSLEEGDGDAALLAEIARRDLDFRHLRALSDGRLIVFRATAIEVHQGPEGHRLTIPSPQRAWDSVWAISRDERYLVGSGRDQTVFVWSLEAGALCPQYAAAIQRPIYIPGELGAGIEATAGGCVWHAPGGPYLHVSDGPRGWATPLTLARDRRMTVVPGRASAALIAVEEPPRVLAQVPFEGRLRASCVLEDAVLLVNSAGRLFRYAR